MVVRRVVQERRRCVSDYDASEETLRLRWESADFVTDTIDRRIVEQGRKLGRNDSGNRW